jgi:hypothetical protein
VSWKLLLLVWYSYPVLLLQKNKKGLEKQASWNGVWQSLLYKDRLVQNNTLITGRYVPISPSLRDNGIINGTLAQNGSVLSGTWAENGNILLNFSNISSTLEGKWASSDESQLFVKKR